MDFARPHILEEGVAARSKIRILPAGYRCNDNVEENASSEASSSAAGVIDAQQQQLLLLHTDGKSGKERADSFSELLIDAANRSAVDLFRGPPSRPYLHGKESTNERQTGQGTHTCTSDVCAQSQEEEDRLLRLADSRIYPERCLAPSRIIKPGALVIVFQSFCALSFVYVTPGQTLSNRHGDWKHEDFIGKPFGCKISSSRGYVYLLCPTPELWSRCLPIRTQIVHESDAAVVVCQLNLRPNCVVCESGTGSGAMSHAILRTIAPRGMLHTYDFSSARVEAARKEFQNNGVGHLVEVHWRDVCGKNTEDSNGGKRGKGGFNIGPAKANAIFLDLPEPELAIPHAAYTIVPCGRIASYSPCIEQSHRLIAALSKFGFHSIRTIEVRLREHCVEEAEIDPLPLGRLPRDPPGVSGAPASTKIDPAIDGGYDGGASTEGTETTVGTAASIMDIQVSKSVQAPTKRIRPSAMDFSGDDTGAEGHTERSEAEMEGPSTNALVAAARNAQEHMVAERGGLSGLPSIVSGGRCVAWDDHGQGQPYQRGDCDGNVGKRRKMLITRPSGTMRGHTAFLTFATASTASYPDPSRTEVCAARPIGKVFSKGMVTEESKVPPLRDTGNDVKQMFLELSKLPLKEKYPKLFVQCRVLIQKCHDTFSSSLPALWDKMRKAIPEELNENSFIIDEMLQVCENYDSGDPPLTIIDLCSGIGYLSMFLSHLLPPRSCSRLIAVDALFPAHNYKSSDKEEMQKHHLPTDHLLSPIHPIPIRPRRANIKKGRELRQIAGHCVAKSSGPVVILGIHLCKSLSVHAVRLFTSTDAWRLYLKPCCLPGKKDLQRKSPPFWSFSNFDGGGFGVATLYCGEASVEDEKPHPKKLEGTEVIGIEGRKKGGQSKEGVAEEEHSGVRNNDLFSRWNGLLRDAAGSASGATARVHYCSAQTHHFQNQYIVATR